MNCLFCVIRCSIILVEVAFVDTTLRGSWGKLENDDQVLSSRFLEFSKDRGYGEVFETAKHTKDLAPLFNALETNSAGQLYCHWAPFPLTQHQNCPFQHFYKKLANAKTCPSQRLKLALSAADCFLPICSFQPCLASTEAFRSFSALSTCSKERP